MLPEELRPPLRSPLVNHHIALFGSITQVLDDVLSIFLSTAVILPPGGPGVERLKSNVRPDSKK